MTLEQMPGVARAEVNISTVIHPYKGRSDVQVWLG